MIMYNNWFFSSFFLHLRSLIIDHSSINSIVHAVLSHLSIWASNTEFTLLKYRFSPITFLLSTFYNLKYIYIFLRQILCNFVRNRRIIIATHFSYVFSLFHFFLLFKLWFRLYLFYFFFSLWHRLFSIISFSFTFCYYF